MSNIISLLPTLLTEKVRKKKMSTVVVKGNKCCTHNAQMSKFRESLTKVVKVGLGLEGCEWSGNKVREDTWGGGQSVGRSRRWVTWHLPPAPTGWVVGGPGEQAGDKADPAGSSGQQFRREWSWDFLRVVRQGLGRPFGGMNKLSWALIKLQELTYLCSSLPRI